MTCLEAQSNIIAYIDGNLEKDKKIEFLHHIQCCSECKEELDIYFTMIEGMRQLDNNLSLTKDFSKELDKRIESELKQQRNKKGFFYAIVSILLLCIFAVGVFSYVNFLEILHQDEQNKIKEKQGEYYYSETFSSYIFDSEYSHMSLGQIVVEPKEEDNEMTYYEKIRYYKALD